MKLVEIVFEGSTRLLKPIYRDACTMNESIDNTSYCLPIPIFSTSSLCFSRDCHDETEVEDVNHVNRSSTTLSTLYIIAATSCFLKDDFHGDTRRADLTARSHIPILLPSLGVSCSEVLIDKILRCDFFSGGRNSIAYNYYCPAATLGRIRLKLLQHGGRHISYHNPTCNDRRRPQILNHRVSRRQLFFPTTNRWYFPPRCEERSPIVLSATSRLPDPSTPPKCVKSHIRPEES